MTVQLKIETKETADLPAHYEQLAYDTLRVLWHRKLLISAILVAAVLLVSVMLVRIGPRYSGEAIIELNFIREVPTAGAQIQPTASVDAAVIVDSAARVIRSRATASAVVARLRLDKDPAFARRSAFSYVQSVLGREAATPSPHDLAVHELMRKITVTNEPRSYLISIVITTGDPEQSANLANAVAVEYLRGQLLQQLTDAQVSAERDLNQLSSVYGVRHPNYVNGRTRLEHWDARLSALRWLPADDVVKLVRGLSLLAAQKVMVPSGPNITLILGLTIAAALGVGIWLARRLGPRRPVRSQRLAVLGELFFRARPRIIDLAFGFLHGGRLEKRDTQITQNLAHLRVFRWSPSVLKSLLKNWSLLRQCVKAPLFALAEVDDDKWARFVTRHRQRGGPRRSLIATSRTWSPRENSVEMPAAPMPSMIGVEDEGDIAARDAAAAAADTTRAPLASPALTGVPAAPTASTHRREP
jgi:capsular polysaccharide biosynthesis protein